MTLTYIL